MACREDGTTTIAHYCRLLGTSSARRTEDGAESVIVWLELDGGNTFRVAITLDDARELPGMLAEALDAFDDDDEG